MSATILSVAEESCKIGRNSQEKYQEKTIFMENEEKTKNVCMFERKKQSRKGFENYSSKR